MKCLQLKVVYNKWPTISKNSADVWRSVQLPSDNKQSYKPSWLSEPCAELSDGDW